jgi:hypothetical protein
MPGEEPADLRFEELLTRREIQQQPRARWSGRDTTGCFAAPAERKEA